MTSSRTMEGDEKNQPGSSAMSIQMSQAEYRDQMETHSILLSAKSQELTELSRKLKESREKKEPLIKVKNLLQEEINKANKAINTKSEEVTLLKQKLRYHSVKQIHENIERLEYQLRNNSYKPREEQKILNEISMLQRSVRTLREYETKQAENKKFRAERTRLIDERNSNYTKIRALYEKEDEVKKAIVEIKEVISSNKKAIDQLKQMKPMLEQAWTAQKQQIAAARQKRIDEKKRLRQDHIRERQEEKRKLWEEYEASREPYDMEKDLCRLLISYLQMSSVNALSTPGSFQLTPSTPRGPTALHALPTTPSTPRGPTALHALPSTPSTPRGPTALHALPSTPSTPRGPTALHALPTTPSTPSKPVHLTPNHTSLSKSASLPLPPSSHCQLSPASPMADSSGSFYKKSKEGDDTWTQVSKRDRRKAKRQQKMANRVKELPHTPDVLNKFEKLSIVPPKNTDDIPAAIIALQDSLQYYNDLSVRSESKSDRLKEGDRASEISKVSRPTSLAIKDNTSTALLAPSPSDAQNSQMSPMRPSELPATPAPSFQSVLTNSLPCPSTSRLEDNTTTFNSLPATTTNPSNNVCCIPNGFHISIPVSNAQWNSLAQIIPSNNDSFYSLPVTYPVRTKEVNNNKGCSYASVVAKLKVEGPAI